MLQLLLGADAPGTSPDLLHQCCDANARLVSSIGPPGIKSPYAAVLSGKDIVLGGRLKPVIPGQPKDTERAR